MAVNWTQAQVDAAVRMGALAGVVSGINRIQNAMIQKIMSPPKTGVVYKRGGRTHQASAPGESPTNDLGNLVASIRQQIDQNNLRGYVIVSAPYAAALEYGALRMAMGGYWELEARPYARPALAENAEDIRIEIQRNIHAAISRVRGGRK